MLLFLHGEEPYLARARLQELKEQAKAEGALVYDIDCKETDLREVFSKLNTSSLFPVRKFLVFRDPFGAKEWGEKEIQHTLVKNDPHTLVFLGGVEKKTDPLVKFLNEHATKEEFPKLQGAKLKSWVAREFKKQGTSFAPGVDELLQRTCGDDLERLSREIQKLVAFRCASEKREVRKEDVLLLVEGQEDPKIFSTIDSIAAKDQKRAAKLLSLHFAKGEAPLQLLSMFAWQFRVLLSIKDLQKRGVVKEAIKTKLKLHPFAFQKNFVAAERFSLEELKELYKKIFDLDLAFKTSGGNPEQLLYLFLARAVAKEKQRLPAQAGL